MKSLFQVTITLSLVFLTPFISNAQKSKHWCGQVHVEEQLIHENPNLEPQIIEADKQLQKETALAQNQRGSRAKKVIPVVFHVIHQNGVENISDAQIHDQMRILNEDYSASNDDLTDVISSFQSRIGDMEIEFRLARKDPSGNATNGIDRIVSSLTNQGGESAKLNSWNRAMYLNIWVVKQWAPNGGIPNGVLAYAYKPASAQSIPTRDGIICLSQYIGSIGTGQPLYARTITHEIGHYLNLSHTWGNTNEPGLSSNCNTDDGINDTPLCIGTFGCNLNGTSCNSLDNIQNHMDYADCTVMFTEGQVNVVSAALNSSVASRNQLSTSSNLNATGVGQLTAANFSANRINICQFESIDFTDKSQYDASNWDWILNGGVNGSSTNQNPTEIYENAGLYNVALTANNGTNTVSENKIGYIMVNPTFGNQAPYFEDFSTINQLNHEKWYAVNDYEDSYEFVSDGGNGINGSACIRLKNHGNEQETNDEILTTTYDLRVFSTVSVSFKIAYAQKTSADISRLTMYMSDDCGKTWTQRWSAIGPTMSNAPITPGSFIPSGNGDYKTFTVNNISGSVLSKSSQFKFVFTNDEGNNVFIDDFNITGSYNNTAQLKYPWDGQSNVSSTEKILWRASGGGVDSYEYQLDTDAGFSSANLQTGINNYISAVDGPDTEFTPSTLTNGATYYWRVRLIKGGQTQPWSDTWSFTVSANGVSTEDLLIQKYQVKTYPNPMKSIGFVEFSLTQGNDVEISLTNLIGQSQVIQNKSYFGSGKHIFNLSEIKLAKGVYLISIQVGTEAIHQRLIVQ